MADHGARTPPARERVCTNGICIFQIISRKMLSGASLLCNGPIFPSSSSLLFSVSHRPRPFPSRTLPVLSASRRPLSHKYMSAHRCRGIDPSILPRSARLLRINRRASPWQTQAIGKETAFYPPDLPFRPTTSPGFFNIRLLNVSGDLPASCGPVARADANIG